MEEEPLKYNITSFCSTLNGLMSSLLLQLRYNYSYLFTKPEPDCHLCNKESSDDGLGDFNLLDPRPMNDGYEFGPGTQELWSDEFFVNS